QQLGGRQALSGVGLSLDAADSQRVRLLHDTRRRSVRHPGERPAGQLVAPGRHKRHVADEFPAHHTFHPGHLRQQHRHRLQRALHHPGQTMKEKVATYTRSQRSQGLTEFAIIAPIILLLTFGIIDFGRALYLYITLQQAANEGARVAVRASYFVDPNGATHTWPTDSDVATAITGHAVIMNLANNPACPNGPLPNNGVALGSPSLPAANTGWIFITDPSQAGNGTPNGPRGGLGTYPPPNLGAGCNVVTPAVGNEAIKVTLWYTFQPVTPIIQQVVGNNIVITAYAIYRAEYSN